MRHIIITVFTVLFFFTATPSYAAPCLWVSPGANYDVRTPDGVWRRCTATVGATNAKGYHLVLTSSQCFRSPNWMERYTTNFIYRNAWPLFAPNQWGSPIGWEQFWIRPNVGISRNHARRSYIDASLAYLPSASLTYQNPPVITSVANNASDVKIDEKICLYSQSHTPSCGIVKKIDISAPLIGTPPPGDIAEHTLRTTMCATPYDAGAPVVTDTGMLIGLNIDITERKNKNDVCMSYVEPIWQALADFKLVDNTITIVL